MTRFASDLSGASAFGTPIGSTTGQVRRPGRLAAAFEIKWRTIEPFKRQLAALPVCGRHSTLGRRSK
jgi:hypothetical protein